MTEIAANTVDVEVHVYESPHKDSYRWSVRPDPDSPGTVNLSHEELAFYDNQTRCGYEKKGVVPFDKAEWEKIKYAVDTVFSKTI